MLNKLSKKDVAIVSETAGTTRDIIEVHMDIKGFPVILADTAGLRDTDDEIESEGVRRARQRADHADLVIAVHDGESWPELDPVMDSLEGQDVIHLLNKVDLMSDSRDIDDGKIGFIQISAKTGAGLNRFLEVLEAEISDRCHLSAAPALTRARHRDSLEECLDSLKRFQIATDTELKAEDLRLAARALGRITGQVGVEDILDIIFAEFCIGK